MTVQFSKIELRTRDISAARAFYASVLGYDLRHIVALPEVAAARGAPPHWLGHIGIGNVDECASAFVANGAQRLGPTQQTSGGDKVALMRDAGGAVVALSNASDEALGVDVAWYQLLTADLEKAIANYQGSLGWWMTEQVDLGAVGIAQFFSWHADRADRVNNGMIIDIARLPMAHPHWLFHFRVPALATAVAAVRAAGGKVVDLTVMNGGTQIAVCDDPQGAAFALQERARL
ncbi:MAG: hypothetical protein NTY08_10920 [Proteobacteria bacterium]|nr:hypothetical protein [Pseudomonadota bacterium]